MTEETVVASFRISGDVYRRLQEETTGAQLSLNTLVNHILREHTDYLSIARKVGMQVINSQTLRAMVDELSEETIARIGSDAGMNVPSSFIMSRFGELNLSNALEYLKLVSAYGRVWEYSESSHEGTATLVISHKLGRGGSILYSHFLESLFRTVGSRPKVSTTDESVILELSDTQPKGSQG